MPLSATLRVVPAAVSLCGPIDPASSIRNATREPAAHLLRLQGQMTGDAHTGAATFTGCPLPSSICHRPDVHAVRPIVGARMTHASVWQRVTGSSYRPAYCRACKCCLLTL